MRKGTRTKGVGKEPLKGGKKRERQRNRRGEEIGRVKSGRGEIAASKVQVEAKIYGTKMSERREDSEGRGKDASNGILDGKFEATFGGLQWKVSKNWHRISTFSDRETRCVTNFR
jgi:hypothetical protein